MASKARPKGKARASAGAPVTQPRPRRDFLPALLCLVLALAALAAYANHFQNDFHFDDAHTVVDNQSIRDLHNTARFFTNAYLFSVNPLNATYRPLTSLSLAIDYWLGGELKPFYFHLSTFLWYLVQLALMFFLFRRIMDQADPSPTNLWTAFFATACYGLHPANAETVNYIIQRGDLYNTLGVVASLLLFIKYPAQRKYCWYMLPAIAAYLSKAPALIFPFILLTYVYLFERGRSPQPPTPSSQPLVWPAFVITGVFAVLTARMTPPTFHPAGSSPSLYRLTQPWVVLHYFKCFFLPAGLSIDSGWGYVSSPLSGQALAGYVFVAAMLAAAFYTSWRRATRPIAFGIVWFFLALLPTSWLPLADVTNDHRMFFPFVGLALAVFWSLRLAWQGAKIPAPHPRAILAALVAVLALEASCTHVRNQVWHTEESLWADAAAKNPHNARGVMGYGHALLNRGEYAQALSYLERAEALDANSAATEANLGIACAALHRDAEAERHFQRAQAIEPALFDTYLTYGGWLKDHGRLAESRGQLEAALRLNPNHVPARELLRQVYAEQQRAGAPSPENTPEGLLNLSVQLCKDGKYPECLAAAQKALELRPAYAEAYNNMAAAYLYMKMWDQGIIAARQALALKPDYLSARRNLMWAMSHRDDAPGGK